MKKIITILFMILLSGCAASPTKEELFLAEYGSYPDNYEKIIQKYMEAYLKDSLSAQYTFLGTPKQGWKILGTKQFGYVICSYINAKNSFGGYTGRRLHYFMIKDDIVIYHLNGENEFSNILTERACSK